MPPERAEWEVHDGTLVRAGVSVSFIELTTLRQDPAGMGRTAAEAARRRIRRPSALPDEHATTPTLVVRGSTAPPRATRKGTRA